MNKYILPDTCFWYALFDNKDSYHLKSVEVYENIKEGRIIFPWPITYEVLRTKFVKNPESILKLKKELSRDNVIWVDDKKYKEDALNLVLDGSAKNSKNEALSLVDAVLNLIIKDVGIRVDYFVTSNVKDFKESCDRRKVNIVKLSGNS